MDSVFLIKAAQLLLSLSILVILHEFGHFLPAKWFGVRVEKFYLFFDAKFSLVKKKIGDTEYGIGWLPLGGYVKLSGMIDESMDKDGMSEEPKEYEFRAKPAWQRLIIMLGGVTVNLILAFVIYSMTLFVWGEKYLPADQLTSGIMVMDSVAYDLGIQDGDKVLSVDGEPIERFNDIAPSIVLGNTFKVERKGEIIEQEVPIDFASKMIEQKSKILFYPRFPFVISEIPKDSPNAGSGLMAMDQITAVDGIPMHFFDEFKAIGKRMAGQEVLLTVDREGEQKTIPVTLSDNGKIGVLPVLYTMKDFERTGLYQLSSIKYGFFESIPAGINKAIDKLVFYVDQFKLILNPETGAYKGLGGFGSLGNLFGAQWEWQSFWEVTAFLSIVLAFMNVLPIPALDGGHVMFLLIEMIIGRPANEKILEIAQITGMVLLFSLLLYANGMDIIRAFQ